MPERRMGSSPFARTKTAQSVPAGVAHLVERSLAKAEVAGSSPVSRSIHETAPRQPRRFMNGFVLRSPLHNQIGWRHSQVVRQRSAKSPPPVRIWVAPPRNPTEVDTISVGFFFASKRKKRPNWALFWKLRFYEGMVAHSFSAQKSF